jgi:hypothetical protein
MTKYFVLSQPNPADPTGTIVFITSGVGGMIIPGMSSYFVAKYAGDRFTEYLHAEYPSKLRSEGSYLLANRRTHKGSSAQLATIGLDTFYIRNAVQTTIS